MIMKKTFDKLSLGLKFVFGHAILTLLIPLWTKIFPSSHSCGLFPCIFSDEQGLFFLFNIPGLFGSFFVLPMLQWFKPENVRLSGKLTMVDYIPIYLISALFYYFAGTILQIVFQIKSKKSIYNFKVKKRKERNKKDEDF